MAGTSIHGLGEGVAAGAAGIGARIEDGGESILAAVVGATGACECVG